MGARQLMTQRALVERSTSPGTDDSGNELPASWSSHIESMPCFLYQSTEGETESRSTTSVTSVLKLLAPKSADVTESDRINGVTDRRGQTVFEGLLDIDQVLLKKDHLELATSRVSS